MSYTVRSILRYKGSEVISIESGATVYDAIDTMVEHNVGSILVLQDEKVVGIFTERDYLRKIALEGRTSRTTKIDEVMSTEVISVTPKETVKQCMRLMTDSKCRHLPVEEGGNLVGVISIGDCVRQISRNAQEEVEEMKNYISGKYPA